MMELPNIYVLHVKLHKKEDCLFLQEGVWRLACFFFGITRLRFLPTLPTASDATTIPSARFFTPLILHVISIYYYFHYIYTRKSILLH